jgi:methionyl-tRNA formyltransferase
MDGTPHGATVHWMNERIDEGDIIVQESFPDDGLASAAAIRTRTREMCLDLFARALSFLVAGRVPRRPQGNGGTYHFRHEILEVTTLARDDTVTMDRIVRLIRGTDFGPYGFWVRDGERTLFVRGRVYQVAKPGDLPADDERR